MDMVNCQNIKKSFADTVVLNNLNMQIKEGERLGLVGSNGCGKSTLANMLFGSMDYDDGVITYYRSDLRIGYLLQSKEYMLNEINPFAGTEIPGQDSYSNDCYTMIKNLGLEDVQQWEAERFSGLSGGEKTRLALANIWAKSPEFLILDEPTNHLDFQGIDWLIGELQSYRGTVLIISHDRYFLDQVVTRIVEIEDGQATSYPGNYTAYREEKARQYEIQLHQYVEQKKKEEKIEGEIDRLKNWSAKAHREAKYTEIKKGGKEFYRSKAKRMDVAVKSRIKRLERMRGAGVSRPKEEPTVSFSLKDAKKHGRRILEAVEIKKTFGERTLFADSSFCIQRGERVGLLGNNGCGKTTLLKIILGEVDLEQGEVWISPSAQIGYLCQDMQDVQPELTVLESLGLSKQIFIDSARKVLANLGIDEMKIEKRIEQLSMGERVRIQLAKLILNQADLLILDEPTNHLDLYSREELEDSLTTYEGTMIIVSHDRYMLEKLCTHLLIFEDARIRKLAGSFREYQPKQIKKEYCDLERYKEELLIVENRLIGVLGSLNQYTDGDPEYAQLDSEFQQLAKRKLELKSKLEQSKMC